jgi:serine/threonine protein kinase
MTNLVDQQLGNYRLTSLIGQGGFADVYLAEHLHLNTRAAIKVLQVRLGETSIEQFRIEARTIASLVHPHIVRVLDFGVEHGIPFLVMDYAPGGSLRQRYPKGTLLPATSIISYAQQIADALQYAHNQHFIHRDVKPENMLLVDSDTLLISDFGLVQVAHNSNSHTMQETAGTAAYIAPEQIQGKPRLASDQYALGAIVYEWLSGAPPFQGTAIEMYAQHLHANPPSLRARVPTIPEAVEQVVLTALAKDPHQRFASIKAFAMALEQAYQTAEGNRPPSGILPPFFLPAKSGAQDYQPLYLQSRPLSRPLASSPADEMSPVGQPSLHEDATYSGNLLPEQQAFPLEMSSVSSHLTQEARSASKLLPRGNAILPAYSSAITTARQSIRTLGVINVTAIFVTFVVLLGSVGWFFSFALPRLQSRPAPKVGVHKVVPGVKTMPTVPPPPPGITFTIAPAAVSWGPNRVDVFGRGSDGALYHNYWDGSWHTFESLGGNFLYGPAVSTWGPGRLDVFAVGMDSALYHTYWDGSWHGWGDRVGGVFTSTPAAVSWGPNRIDVFDRGTDNAIWHNYWDPSGWHAFDSLGGGFVSAPAVSSWGAGRLDVFGTGGDNALYHDYWDGTWHGWTDRLAGTFTSAPAAVSWGPNRIDVFCRGTDNAIWHTAWDGTWHPFESLGGAFSSGPASAAWAAGRLDVFSIGADNALYHNYWDGNWHGWNDRLA